MMTVVVNGVKIPLTQFIRKDEKRMRTEKKKREREERIKRKKNFMALKRALKGKK